MQILADFFLYLIFPHLIQARKPGLILSQRGLVGASSEPVHLLLCSQVFQTLHATGQSSMVRDWVLLSLSNFTQRTPVAMAMWSLSCFFVSASTSQWISALYPDLY